LGRWRLVPIHASTVAALADYLRRREEFLGGTASRFVFISNRGTRLDIGRVHRAFYTLSRQTGLRAHGARNGSRLHDFRHNSESGIIPSTASTDAALPEVTSVLSRY